jgi:hypothetical protein
MSELSYNPGADAIFEKFLPEDFVSRKNEDMSKYPTIIEFPDQSMTVFSKKKTKKEIELIIKRYNGRKSKCHTRFGRPIVVERIKEINN